MPPVIINPNVISFELDSTIYAVSSRWVPNDLPVEDIPSFGSGHYTYDLLWYRHKGYRDGSSEWEGWVSVGNDWNFSQVVSAGKGKIYAVEWDGDLLWYRHKGYLDGTKRWLGPVDVGDGFAVASFDPGQDSRIGIFCDCQSGLFSLLSPTGTVIYSVRLNGSLEWYPHDGASSGTISWANGGQPTLVGTGWVAGNRRVFSGGNGVIYLIRDDGTLTWYKHRGYLDGSFDWEQPRDVGDGWDVFTNVFSIGGGIIYAIASDGTLWWYKHNGYQTGEANWEDRKSVGSNWNGLQVVANSVHLKPTIIL